MFNINSFQEEVFIIAEVGQNHQGSLDFAREYIKIFADAGADAIKFQTRNNKYLFSQDAYDANYESENAFAETYGAHREHLELRPEWLPILKGDCDTYGVKFMSTPFDEPSLELLLGVSADIIKVASFDLGNLPFINRLAKTHIPIVMSIGGGNVNQIKSSLECILSEHNDVALLHCVSEYPCEFNKLGLNNIETLKQFFPSILVGLSDHFNGTLSGPIAYTKGARIFEKHVTLNRAWKGTDHSFALEPEGFKKFVRDIRRVRHMLPPKSPSEIGKEPVFQKLGKSLVAHQTIPQGAVISMDDLSGRIFRSQFLPVRQSNEVIGRMAKRTILQGEKITFEDLIFQNE